MNNLLENIKGIIFDYGGTIDTGGDHWSYVIEKAYKECGVALSDVDFRQAYVEGERELARTRHILPHHNFSDLLKIKINIELQWLANHGLFAPQDVERYGEEIASKCYQSAKQSVENARPVLETLARKYPMVLVSNFYGNIKTVLEDFNILDCFREIVESAVVGVRKPDPEIFMIGVRKLNLEPQEVAVVGDSMSKDIIPASKCGCRAIWIKGRAWTEEEDAVEYPLTISSLSQLL